jgi:hypothetical protein
MVAKCLTFVNSFHIARCLWETLTGNKVISFFEWLKTVHHHRHFLFRVTCLRLCYVDGGVQFCGEVISFFEWLKTLHHYRHFLFRVTVAQSFADNRSFPFSSDLNITSSQRFCTSIYLEASHPYCRNDSGDVAKGFYSSCPVNCEENS